MPSSPPKESDAASSIVRFFGFSASVLLPDGDELRERADAMVRRSSVDLVARPEVLHACAGTNHDTGHVVTQNERCAVGHDELELATSKFRIQKVHPGRVDLDENLILPHVRVCQLTSP